MIRIACSDSEASCLIASLITEIAMPCPCEGGPLRICGTGPDGAPAEVRILGGGAERRGLAEDVDEDFGLIVRRTDGARETVRSGEVSVRGLYGYV